MKCHINPSMGRLVGLCGQTRMDGPDGLTIGHHFSQTERFYGDLMLSVTIQRILCFVDRASLYNLVNKANLV